MKILYYGPVVTGVIATNWKKCSTNQTIIELLNMELKNMKEQRWYKIKGKQAFIFDSGYEDKSQSVSIVPKEQLSYYRNNFNLQKVWEG